MKILGWSLETVALAIKLAKMIYSKVDQLEARWNSE